jgi:hypothetical protein
MTTTTTTRYNPPEYHVNFNCQQVELEPLNAQGGILSNIYFGNRDYEDKLKMTFPSTFNVWAPDGFSLMSVIDIVDNFFIENQIPLRSFIACGDLKGSETAAGVHKSNEDICIDSKDRPFMCVTSVLSPGISHNVFTFIYATCSTFAIAQFPLLVHPHPTTTTLRLVCTSLPRTLCILLCFPQVSANYYGRRA